MSVCAFVRPPVRFRTHHKPSIQTLPPGALDRVVRRALVCSSRSLPPRGLLGLDPELLLKGVLLEVVVIKHRRHVLGRTVDGRQSKVDILCDGHIVCVACVVIRGAVGVAGFLQPRVEEGKRVVGVQGVEGFDREWERRVG